MGVLSEIYSGDRIINQYKSSNIKGSIYNKSTKKLIVEFNAGRKYEYEDVPDECCCWFKNS